MPTAPPQKTSAEQAREIGRALRALRERHGLSQEQAAERMHVTRTAWQNYENGRAVVLRTDMQLRLAAAAGGSHAELLAVLREQQGQLAAHSAFTGHDDGRAIYSGPGRSQAIFPTDQGDVILSYPANLTPEAKAQLAAYLKVFLNHS